YGKGNHIDEWKLNGETSHGGLEVRTMVAASSKRGLPNRRARSITGWCPSVPKFTQRGHSNGRKLRNRDTRRGSVSLVVVSNRVARGKANEPMTGGLAAALLPVVEKSGAIWVGSSGRVRDGLQKEPLAEIEALGTGALAILDLPAAHYGGYYEGFANS